MQVTIFRDAIKATTEVYYISVGDALERIKLGRSKEKVEKIRALFAEGKDYDELKKSLPSVIFAGTADKVEKDKRGNDTLRNDGCVTKHSGFFVLDFDEGETEVIKARLIKDTYIYAVWKGVTKGCKALVKCPQNITNHSLYYNAFLQRYPELDTTSKNIGRLCFESYDPELWVNPNSLVWDKTLTDEEYRNQKKSQSDKRRKKLKDITASMIRGAREGEKHNTLLKAARLLGGYKKLLPRDEAFNHLLGEIKKRKIKDLPQAKNTINDGLDYGAKAPLHEIKEIEKDLDFTRREDGSYDFMADEDEMDEYEEAVVTGTLEMGLPTGFSTLDNYFLFKRHTLVWLAARDNVGKSFLFWYLSVIAATLHGWKILMYAKENRDGAVRKKIKEFYIGKSIKEFSEDEHALASDFIKNHYKFFTAKKMHTAEDWLLKCEIIYDEGWEYDLVIGDPYNAFDLPVGENQYSLNLRVLNKMQTFKENYSALWVTDHIGSKAARDKSNNGELSVPTKHDVEYGQMKPNKIDDFLIAHRNLKDEGLRFITELHVDKIKDTETGGRPTPKDNPVQLIVNKNLCGFRGNGVDPIEEYWNRKNGVDMPQSSEFSNHF